MAASVALQQKRVMVGDRLTVVRRQRRVCIVQSSRAGLFAIACCGLFAIAPVLGNPPELERQGQLIQISGRDEVIDGAWGIWQQQVAVDVLWLAKHLEVELRSGDDPFFQTLQWSSRPSITVPAFWNQGALQRFVPLASLTEAWGWQFDVQGDRLFISIPALSPLSQNPPASSPFPTATPKTDTDVFPRPLDLAWLPGIRVQQQTVAFGERRVSVAIAALDVSQQSLRLRPFWAAAERLEGIRDTRSAALFQRAALAINGGYFNRNTQQPLGAIRRDGEWISSPILGRGVVAWNDVGEFLFSRLQYGETATLARGETIAVSHLNSGYVQAGWARYSPAWGDRYTTQTDGETIVTVRAGAIAAIQQAEAAGKVTTAIPTDGYLLLARQSAARDRANTLQVGELVTLSTQLNLPELANYPHGLGGGPLLLQNGQMVLDAELEQFRPPFPTQQAARSAIGRRADGTILLVTAGKGREFAGVTLAEMAALMQQLGCTDALNFDGGTSSTLYVGGETANFVGSPPRVHNYLGVFVDP